MHIPHIDKIPQNLLHFAFDSNSTHEWHNEGNFNRLQKILISFTVETFGTGIRIFKGK